MKPASPVVEITEIGVEPEPDDIHDRPTPVYPAPKGRLMLWLLARRERLGWRR